METEKRIVAETKKKKTKKGYDEEVYQQRLKELRALEEENRKKSELIFGKRRDSETSEGGGESSMASAEARADSPSIGVESSLPKPSVEGEASPSVKPEADAAETPLSEPSGESESPTSSEVAASSSENVKSSHRTLRKEKTGRVLVPRSYIKKLDIYCLFSSRTHIDVLTEALDSYFEAHSVPGVSLDAMLRKIRNSNR